MRGFSTVTLILAAALMAACQSTPKGQQQAQKLSDQIETFGRAASSAGIELDTALTVLGSMVNSEGGDLSAPYKQFASSVDKCDKEVKGLQTKLDAMDKAAAQSFLTWEGNLETIETESIRNQSRQQLEDARASYSTLNTHGKAIIDAFQPILGTLRDVSSLLGNNLTAASVKSQSGLLEQVKKDASELDAKIAEIKADVEKWVAANAPKVEEEKKAAEDAAAKKE